MNKRKTKAQKRMEGAVAILQDYMQTYSEQSGYLDYKDVTLIDDVLYVLGLALYHKRFAQGFDEFKVMLRKHLADGAEQTLIQQIREECAKALELSNSELLLLAGEMPASELRTVKEVLKNRAQFLRSPWTVSASS